MPTADRPTAPFSSYALMAIVGAALALAIGALATVFYDNDRLLVFTVFAIMVATPSFALTWLLFVAPHTVIRSRHADDEVERRWLERASGAAFQDLLIVAGIALAVLSITRFDMQAETALLLLVVLAMLDVAARYLVFRRRDS